MWKRSARFSCSGNGNNVPDNDIRTNNEQKPERLSSSGVTPAYLYYSQPKKEIRLRHMKKQNPTRTVRYPVLHFEKEAAPVKVLKFLLGFFQEAAFPF